MMKLSKSEIVYSILVLLNKKGAESRETAPFINLKSFLAVRFKHLPD